MAAEKITCPTSRLLRNWRTVGEGEERLREESLQTIVALRQMPGRTPLPYKTCRMVKGPARVLSGRVLH